MFDYYDIEPKEEKQKIKKIHSKFWVLFFDIMFFVKLNFQRQRFFKLTGRRDKGDSTTSNTIMWLISISYYK